MRLYAYKLQIGMHNRQNQQLEHRFKYESSFSKQMNKIYERFQAFEQQAFYSELEQSTRNFIVAATKQTAVNKKISNKQNIDWFVILGARQEGQTIQKLILNIITAIPLPKETYSIIYINTLAPKNAYNDFVKITELLPIQYFIHLDSIYVLHASFLSRALSWVSFNTITNYIKDKTVYCSEFMELAEKAELNKIELLNLLPQFIRAELKEQEDAINFFLNEQAAKIVKLTMAKSQGHEGKGQKNEKNKEQKGMNVVSGQVMLLQGQKKKPINHEIQDYVQSQAGAPLALEMLIYYFNQRSDSLNAEGLFRKSVSIDDEHQILFQLQKQNYNYIETITDPHVIANAIKRFLANLITPIVPYPMFNKLMATGRADLIKETIASIKALSEVRKKTLIILFQFFLEKVIPREGSNKMGLKNICIVTGPCIMRSEVASIKDLIYSQQIIVITQIIFKQFDNIFGNKKERMLALRKSAKLYNKVYLQERLGRFQSKINDPNLHPCELTASQEDIIKTLMAHSQHPRQYQLQEKKTLLLRNISMSIRQQLQHPSEQIRIEEDLLYNSCQPHKLQKPNESLIKKSLPKKSSNEKEQREEKI